MIQTIAIIGTGAVGGYYGALLQKAGFDVHFLVHHDFNHIQKNGLKIDSPNGNFLLPKVKAYTNPKKLPLCDLAIIALKTTTNSILPSFLPFILKRDGIVLTLQNGLGNEEELSKLLDPSRIYGGLCFLCSNKIAPGHIQHLDYGLITLGKYIPNIHSRLNELHSIFETASIPTKIIENLSLARWKKLIWNIPFNGLSVVHNMQTNQLVLNPKIRKRCHMIMNEVSDAAQAYSQIIEPSFIEKMILDTEKMKPYSPSMKLDFERGNPMEIESIYKAPLEAAKKRGIKMPETEKLYQQLVNLNKSNLIHSTKH